MNHTRLLSVEEVLARRGGSRSRFYDELNKHSARHDPDIPQPIKDGRRTFFVEEEIEAWLKRKIERFRAQPTPHCHP